MNSTALSKYFWQLKDGDITPIITWDIIAKTKSNNGKSERCILCLVEKYAKIYINNIHFVPHHLLLAYTIFLNQDKIRKLKNEKQ